MGNRNEILQLLWKYDRDDYHSNGDMLADGWINALFSPAEVQAWLEFGVTDPTEAQQRRADQRDLPPYYLDDSE